MSYYEKIDEKLKLIPLTFEPMFNIMFKHNLKLIKRFIVEQLDLDYDLEDEEVYIGEGAMMMPLNNKKLKKISIILTLNDKCHKGDDLKYIRKKVFLETKNSFILTFITERKDDIESELYQIILNTSKLEKKTNEKRIVLMDSVSKKEMQGFSVNIRNIEYYRKKYYNNQTLELKYLWLVAISSRTFQELWDILKLVIDDTEVLNRFMKKIIKLSSDEEMKNLWKEYQK